MQLVFLHSVNTHLLIRKINDVNVVTQVSHSYFCTDGSEKRLSAKLSLSLSLNSVQTELKLSFNSALSQFKLREIY